MDAVSYAGRLISLLEARQVLFPAKEEIQTGVWMRALSVADRSRDLLR